MGRRYICAGALGISAPIAQAQQTRWDSSLVRRRAAAPIAQAQWRVCRCRGGASGSFWAGCEGGGALPGSLDTTRLIQT
ncbi:hypothetical protein Y1Q_0007781 [Alligator mississippiensis]|uniref:Uncharacterized protein n=1 Tax=Alligator mississippiensis TaxID=8496 RepID=A0A151N757_ALLMI|nr:hypothetical protein Y1Q_0007781 [Alligator mississippiensis]